MEGLHLLYKTCLNFTKKEKFYFKSRLSHSLSKKHKNVFTISFDISQNNGDFISIVYISSVVKKYFLIAVISLDE